MSTAATEEGLAPTPIGDCGAWLKPPKPVPRRIVTLFEELLATARSTLPSALKSPAAIEEGFDPTPIGDPDAWLNTPPPLPRRIATALELLMATARSSLPSELRSLSRREETLPAKGTSI